MSINFSYACSDCGITRSNQELNSMACECGGEFKLSDSIPNASRPFDAGWCPTLKQNVSSWKDQEKKMLSHRSYSHPEGFTPIQDNKKWMNELRYIRKHKREYQKKHEPLAYQKWLDSKRNSTIYSYAK